MQRGARKAEIRHKPTPVSIGPRVELRKVPDTPPVQWDSMRPVSYWDPYVQEIMRAQAAEVLQQCEQERLEVILEPAPRPRFDGHKIRVATNSNPQWYKELYTDEFKKHRFLAALRCVQEGTDRTATEYSVRSAFWEKCPPVKRLERLLVKLERERETPIFKTISRNGKPIELIRVPRWVQTIRHAYHATARDIVFKQLTGTIRNSTQPVVPCLEICLYFGMPTDDTVEYCRREVAEYRPEQTEPNVPYFQEFNAEDLPF